MDDSELTRVRRGDYLQFADGEVIFSEGSLGKEIYIIVSGKVEISQRIGGRNETIAMLEKGDFFGEMAPLTGEPRSATAVAVGNVFLRMLSLDEMFQDMQNDPRFMRDAFLRMAKRLKHTTSQLRMLILRTRPDREEDDTRPAMVSYLQKKIREKDKQIESLRKQLELSRRKRSLFQRLFGEGRRWLYWVIGVLVITALLIAFRELMPERWSVVIRMLPWR